MPCSLCRTISRSNATVDARVLSANEDDLSAEVTFGKLGVENNNGWILADGVTGGAAQTVSLSDFNHSLGSPFSAAGPPVGVGELYEADGELRLKPKWNADTQAGREAHSAVKFAFANGLPLQWSYGMQPTPTGIEQGEGPDDPFTVTAADFFEASPVLRGAHSDATTLAASRIIAASNHTQEGAPMPEDAKPEGTVEVRPLYDLDIEELAGKIGQKFEGALETLTAAADAPKFQAQEKEIGELRERIRQIENTPAAAEQFAAMGGGNPIENAWAAGKHDWEVVKKQASGNGVYVAELDIDPRALFAATVTTATGVTGLPERVGYDFSTLGRIGLTQMLPTFPTGATSVRFQRETIATAARPGPTAEAAASPEANIAYADQDRPIEHIRGLVPVTEQELDDQPFMEALISGRMGDLVQANLENQVLQGSGTTPNLTGINGTSSVQTATAAYNATARTRVVNFLTALGVVAGLD